MTLPSCERLNFQPFQMVGRPSRRAFHRLGGSGAASEKRVRMRLETGQQIVRHGPTGPEAPPDIFASHDIPLARSADLRTGREPSG